MAEQAPTTTESKRQISPVGAGVAGAVAGAAIGAAVAVALSDAETRKKLQKNVKILKDRMVRVMDTLDEAELEEAKTTAEHKLDEVKNSTNQPFVE